MRPKKVILCAFENEQDLSVLKIVLVTHRYRVFDCRNKLAAASCFGKNHIDLVLTEFESSVVRMKQARPYVPVMLICDLGKLSGNIHCADALLNKKTLQTWELLERVKIMSARKRGPRKATLSTAREVAS